MTKLEEGEKIILEARKHWFVAAIQILGFFVLSIMPLAGFLFAGNFMVFKEIIESGGDNLLHLNLFLFFMWLLLIWVSLFVNLAKYYLDVWVLTDKRLFDIDQKLLFNRDKAVLSLENIQDVVISHRGVIQTLFDFGDIHVQTAGERREFVMKNIADPEKVKNAIYLEYRKIKERVVSVKLAEF